MGSFTALMMVEVGPHGTARRGQVGRRLPQTGFRAAKRGWLANAERGGQGRGAGGREVEAGEVLLGQEREAAHEVLGTVVVLAHLDLERDEKEKTVS